MVDSDTALVAGGLGALFLLSRQGGGQQGQQMPQFIPMPGGGGGGGVPDLSGIGQAFAQIGQQQSDQTASLVDSLMGQQQAQTQDLVSSLTENQQSLLGQQNQALQNVLGQQNEALQGILEGIPDTVGEAAGQNRAGTNLTEGGSDSLYTGPTTEDFTGLLRDGNGGNGGAEAPSFFEGVTGIQEPDPGGFLSDQASSVGEIFGDPSKALEGENPGGLLGFSFGAGQVTGSAINEVTDAASSVASQSDGGLIATEEFESAQEGVSDWLDRATG